MKNETKKIKCKKKLRNRKKKILRVEKIKKICGKVAYGWRPRSPLPLPLYPVNEKTRKKRLKIAQVTRQKGTNKTCISIFRQMYMKYHFFSTCQNTKEMRSIQTAGKVFLCPSFV